MNQYDIAVVYDPDLEIDLDRAEGVVKKIISDNGGKLINTDNWGKRKLAYPIKKHESGIYVFYEVQLEPSAIGVIESSLNITDEAIRFLITKPDLKKRAEAEAERELKLKKNAARANDNESDDSAE